MAAIDQIPFPLKISPKQDSWDKLQLLQHIHPDLKLTAAEFNKILAALDYLYSNRNVGDYKGNVPISLKQVNPNLNSSLGLQIEVVRYINQMPNYVVPDGYTQWFYHKRAVITNAPDDGDDAPEYAFITDYFLLARKIPPVNGVASIGTGGTQLSVDHIVQLPSLDSRNVAPQEFMLGDIGTAEIWNAVNNASPKSTPNMTTILFRAIQNGVEKTWLYKGEQEEVGTGFPPTGPEDYRLLDGSSSDPEPEPMQNIFRNYPNIDAMLNDFENQTAAMILFVRDASDDPNLSFSGNKKYAFYKTGIALIHPVTINNYLLLSSPYGLGGTGIYQGASPTTRTVGGLNSGTNISGKTYDELFEAMLAEYVAPSISSFSMEGQNSPIEVGTVISGNKNFSFGFSQSGNVANNTIKIIDVTDGNNVLAYGLSKSSPQNVNVGSVSKTTAATNQWRIEAESTKGATIRRDMSIQWQYRYFFGGSATDVDTSTKVRALATSGLDSGGTNNVNVTAGTAHTEFYFFVQNGRKIDAVIDTSALNADITSAYVLQGTITVNDNGSNPQTYKKYKLTLAGAYETPHVHSITIKNN